MMKLEIFLTRMCNYLAIFFLMIFLSCSRNSGSANPEKFDPVPVKTLLDPLVEEISGIADSESEPGIIWGIEDSGNPPQLSVIGHDAHSRRPRRRAASQAGTRSRTPGTHRDCLEDWVPTAKVDCIEVRRRI